MALKINGVTVSGLGKDGKDGVGVPSGGTSGQILVKNSETDYDTVWSDKPTYTADEVGADVSGAAAEAVSAHNTATDAHADIRAAIQSVSKEIADLIVTEGGDTLTWDGNTEGLVSSVDMLYKVSDTVPTKNDFANGCLLVFAAEGATETDSVNVTGEEAQGSFADDGCAMIGNSVVIVPYDNYTMDDILLAEKGIYFINYGGMEYVSSLTIPGYTGFVTTALNEKYIPNDIVREAELKAKLVQPDWNQTSETALDYIKNKPDITSVVLYSSLKSGENVYRLYADEQRTEAVTSEKLKELVTNPTRPICIEEYGYNNLSAMINAQFKTNPTTNNEYGVVIYNVIETFDGGSVSVVTRPAVTAECAAT